MCFAITDKTNKLNYVLNFVNTGSISKKDLLYGVSCYDHYSRGSFASNIVSALTANISDNEYPSAKSIADNYNYYIVNEVVRRKTLFTLTIQDHINWLGMLGKVKDTQYVNKSKEAIKNLSIPYVKRALRNEDKTFVSSTVTNEAGQVTVINPIEVKMKPIVDALNAPKLAGLTEALATIGVVVTNPVISADWAIVEAEKDAVYYGEVTAHPAYDGSIILLLGPEGYNAWVKEYNEGK